MLTGGIHGDRGTGTSNVPPMIDTAMAAAESHMRREIRVRVMSVHPGTLLFL
jgi:hypothetical protein